MATISRDNPWFFITSVAHDRLPVFRTDALKKIVCAALDKARHSRGFALYAYVVMPDHLHLITEGSRKPSDTLRFHQNRVRAGLAERAEDYFWSSARCWTRGPREDEPLLMDLDKIVWREPR